MMETTQSNFPTGLGIGLALFCLVLALGLYVFYSYCLKLICQKAGRDPGVLIWIPFVQLVPLLGVAGLSVWMILLFFVPIANFVLGIVMWVKICQARGKSGWLVLLMFVPIANLIFVPYLAFSK